MYELWMARMLKLRQNRRWDKIVLGKLSYTHCADRKSCLCRSPKKREHLIENLNHARVTDGITQSQ